MNGEPEFYLVSKRKLAILFLSTFALYILYWYHATMLVALMLPANFIDVLVGGTAGDIPGSPACSSCRHPS